MSSPRYIALFLAVTMLASTVVLLPGLDDAEAQDGPSSIPVDFSPTDLNRANLYFWREGGGQTSSCTVNESDSGFCATRLSEPTQSHLDPTYEERDIRGSATGDNATSTARFMLDTDGEDGVRGKGALMRTTCANADRPDCGVRIKSGAQAIQYQFWVDTSNACSDLVDNPVEVTMQLRRVPEGDFTENSILSQTRTSEVICPTGAGFSSNDAIQIAQSVTLDQPIRVDKGQTLIAEVFVSHTEDTVNQEDWRIYFQESDFPSKVVLRTDQLLEQAVWTTDATGALKTTFDPNAPEDQRQMTSRFSLRSPFGSTAVPGSGFEGEIEDPDGEKVDLFPSTEASETTVDYETVDGLEAHEGARKVYQFAEEDDIRPWQYPEGVRSGPYTVIAVGNVLGQSLDLETTIAMGAFDFEIGPLAEETTNHDLKPGTSTTFLLRLSNDGSTDDVYEIDSTFDFSEPSGAPQWTVDLIGADQNDRVSLNAGESALLRVTLTPPSEATAGDAARVQVTATSTASDSTKSLSLQGTITQQTSREVRVLVFQEDPFTVGVDRTTQFQVFAWNKGTAPDTISASLVDGSFDPDDPDQFTARLPQKTFSNVPPGSVASVPIQVTTTDEVTRDQRFNFSVEFASTNVPEESDTGPIETIVEAIRSFDLTALDGTNDQALKSTRFGKFNISEPPTPPLGEDPRDCGSPDEASNFYNRNCRDYSNWTFHRFEITNTGDLTETFDLSLLGGVNASTHFDHETREGDDDGCVQILQDERFDEDDTGFVSRIDYDNPGNDDIEISQLDIPAGEAQVVYLRVAYDGTQYSDDVGSEDDACKWESYEPSIEVSIVEGSLTRSLETTTRIYTLHPGDGEMEDNAQARLALSDGATRNGTFVELPDFSGVEPGEETVLPFTLSIQSGHYDPANVTLGPRNLVEDLRDDGWTLELVPNATGAIERSDGGLLMPATRSLTAENPGPQPFHLVTGGDYEMGLRVGPPETGVQEDVRYTFTVAASSSQDANVDDTLGIGVQIGEDFAFDIDEGTTELDAAQGDSVAFGMTIRNTGATRDTYNIDATISPGSFDQPTVRRSSVDISSGSSKTVSLQVDVPQGAQAGTPATVDVEVTAEAGTADTADDIGPRTVTYTVNVRNQGTLSIDGPADDVRIEPGGQNALNFTITNDQNTERSVTLSEVVAPEGFSTTLTQGNTTISVPAQGSESFTYLVEAPSDIVKGSVFPFTLRAEDTNDADDFATGVGYMVVVGQTAVELTPEEDRLVVDRGGNTTFPVLVDNPGTQPAFYNLRVEFGSADWSARILDSDGDPIQDNQIRVPEQAFERIQVDVRAPEEVDQGHVEAVTLTATAEGNASVEDQVTLQAAIHDYAVSIQVDGPTSKPAIPGDDLEYTVSIRNDGNGHDTVTLGFEGLDDEEPTWPMSSELADGTTPRLAPGETLEDITVEVHVPGPGEGPVPIPEGLTSVIRATSSGELPNGGSPTATTQIVTRLVKYQRFDVDGDGAFEMGVDLNRDASDGFEVFADRDATLIERGQLDSESAVRSSGLHTLDADEDGRIEHVVDTNSDGIGEKYFDPDRAQAYTIPYTVDANEDGQPDHPVDSNFDGRIDGIYDAASDSTHKTVHLDFSGDGRRDLLTDTNDDTLYDTYIDPNESPPIVTSVNRDGDVYKMDTDDNGQVDTHYDVASGEIADARTANLGGFLADHWWFLVLFVLVVGLFGVVVYRRL